MEKKSLNLGVKMSNFICPECGKEIIDSLKGFLTGCPHYPIEELPATTENKASTESFKARLKYEMERAER